MADPIRPSVGAEFFYGTMLSAAGQRETTAAMWSRLRDFAARSEVSFPSDIFQQVNRLRANATGVARASRSLQGAPASEAITASVIGRPIYARPASSFEALAQYEARFRLTVQGPEGLGEQWVRITYGSDLPDTVGGLMDDLATYALDLFAGYGQELVGWDSPMLNQI